MSNASLVYTMLAHAAVFVLAIHLLAFVFEYTELPNVKLRQIVVAVCVTYLFWFFT